MKKKFYLIAAIALMGWHTGYAQVNRSPHHLLFGMKTRATEKKAYLPATDKREGKAGQTDSIRTVSLDQLPKIPYKADDKVTATLLTGYTVTSESGTTNASIAYNDNGRIKSIDDGSYRETWEYVEGTHGKWTERTVKRIEKYSNKVRSTEKHVRTQDAQGRIVTEKIYGSMDDLPLTLEHSYAYSYDIETQGYLFVTEDINYLNTPEGDGYRIAALPGNQFTRCEWNDYNREEVTRNGNTYVFTRKYKNGNDTWVTVYQKTIFSDDNDNETGYIEINRNDDGSISYVYGRKTETQKDTPSAGYQTSITYLYTKADDADNILDNYAWVPAYKKVYTDNYNDDHITLDGKPRTEYSYTYDSSTQNWTETGYDINEWVKPNIMKCTTTYESDGRENKEVYYTVYSDEGEDIGSAMLFSDGSYVVMNYDETTNMAEYEEFIYTVYNAQNVVQKMYKQVEYKNERYDGFNSYFSAEPVKWYIWNGSEWQLTTGTLQFGDSDNRLICTLDSQGRPTEVYEYENGKVDDHYKYTYLANGYIDEVYEMKADGRDEYLSESYTRTIDSDGTYEIVEYEYTEGGYAKYGKKTRHLSNGINETYDWSNGAFTLSSRYVNGIVTEEDGVRTDIYRELEENGDSYDIVEKRKFVTINRGNEYTVEEYTMEDGAWVGQSKTSTFRNDDSGFTWRLVKPLTECGIGYSNYSEMYNNIHNNLNRLDVGNSNIDYEWADGHWVATRSNTCDLKVNGDTETLTVKNMQDYYSSTETYTYKRDSEERLLEEKVQKSTTDNELTTNSSYEMRYTYDNEGRLITEQETSSNDGTTTTTTTTYIYGKVSISGIEGTVRDGKPTVTVNGLVVTAEGCSSIALYSLDGLLVGKSTDGSVTAPTKGLYILKAGQSNVKVTVR